MKQKGFVPIIILILIALAVVGYFGYKNYWPKSQTPVVISPIVIATPDPTVNWKTYTNSKVGFELKYPQRYSKPALPSGLATSPTIYANGTEDDAVVNFSNGSSLDSYSLVVCPFTGTADEFRYYTCSPVSFGLSSGTNDILIKNVQVDGAKANWYGDSSGGGFITIYFVGKNHGFILNTTANHAEEITQILSTFKFLDQNQGASNWKTYKTPKLLKLNFPSVTFRYLSDWVIDEKDDGSVTLNLKFSKNGYEVTFYQAAMGGGVCLFDDSPVFEGPSGDYRSLKYTEIKSNFGILRYFIDPNNSKKYSFCQKSGEYFASLSIGVVELNVPAKTESKVFEEAIEIVKSITINQ